MADYLDQLPDAISGPHSDEYEGYCLLGYCDVTGVLTFSIIKALMIEAVTSTRLHGAASQKIHRSGRSRQFTGILRRVVR
jgi:hypothetical protein